ncbi:hypothetical protein RUM43_014397 [Polyplax serrata]|uniref:Uncharacterized protein n=1 Tax=Polyplax serrata TaxID=468196 RepID=A0AAN8NVH8_POLSC
MLVLFRVFDVYCKIREWQKHRVVVLTQRMKILFLPIAEHILAHILMGMIAETNFKLVRRISFLELLSSAVVRLSRESVWGPNVESRGAGAGAGGRGGEGVTKAVGGGHKGTNLMQMTGFLQKTTANSDKKGDQSEEDRQPKEPPENT